MSVQNSADFLGKAGCIIRIGGAIGIGVPGIKIQGHMMRRAVVDESFAVASIVRGKGFAVAANFEGGIDRLQGTSSFFIQRVKLFWSAEPE